MLGHEESRTIISTLGTGIGVDEFDISKCRYGKLVLMTDADVDGAHIRTLLLTFLFRQMPLLFEEEKVYIAQPPLYEISIKGKKKSEYILSESQMRKRMITRGLEETKLFIYNDSKKTEINGSMLKSLVKMLGDIERSISVLQRRGIIFKQFVENYYNGDELPVNFIYVGGESEFYYSKDEFEKRRAELIGTEVSGEKNREVIAEEMHEVKRANEINTKLKSDYSLDFRDFLLEQERKVSGEAVPTKFVLVNGQDEHKVASLGDICLSIRHIGGKGIEIKRFKGLGEMNADQLWDTTMNPAKRTLLKVTLEDAGEADRLFSILMGEDVEKRRNFIQEHALEVQNLDI